MYDVPKWLAQNILAKARSLSGVQIIIFVIDADGVYEANWSYGGFAITKDVPPEVRAWYRDVWFKQPHLALRIRLNNNYRAYIGLWSIEPTIHLLTKQYLQNYNQSKEGFNFEDDQKELKDVRNEG